jgi:hypothetical protein
MQSRINIAAFLICFIAWSAYAQKFSMDIFHEGSLYLYESDTLEGRVKYDFSAEQIQVQIGERLLAYNTGKIDKVVFKDELSGIVRELRVFEYSLSNNGYDLPVLFEFLLEGKIQVLSRESVVWESNTNFISPYTMPITTSQRREIRQLYFRSSISGKIKRYGYSKGDLMMFVRSKSSQVKSYMKRERLKATRNEDVVHIIDYFNKLR